MNTISSMKVPGLTEDKCVTLIGMAGAGKSTVGRAVAERLGWAYVDTDHLIESTYGARLQDVTDALDKERFLDVEARVIQSLRMQRHGRQRGLSARSHAVSDLPWSGGLP